jgi:hypothetical protein
MKKLILAALLIALVPQPGAAQMRGGRGRQQQRLDGQAGMNRAQLERQILQRFVEQSGREIGLNGPTQSRLQQILNESNARRRELTQEGAQLRQRLIAAVRSSDTSDEEFSSILADIDALREREHELWRKDQESLSKELTPRQRALFTVRWLRFQENIRDLIDRRQGGGGGPPPPEGGAPGGADAVISGRRSGG